jgi:hypothetical protein
MTFEFWLGICASFPLSIVVNLITPPLQRWFDSKSKERSFHQLRRAREQLEQLTRFHDNPDLFTQFLVYTALKTTYVGALMTVLAALLFAVALAGGGFLGATAGALRVEGYLGSIAYVILLLASAMIMNILRPALSTWNKLRNFDEFKSRIERQLDAEIGATVVH